jgi:flagellar basal body-associated protein FliL
MVKLLLTGLWVCVVTLGAVYFSVQMSAAPAPVDEEARKKELLELVRGESITIPVISDGAISGYFLSRVSFMMDKEKIKGVKLPMTELTTDELFTLLIGNKMVDLSKPGAFELEKFRSSIKDDLNKKLGDGLVAEVLVEQLDYLSKEDIRNNASRGNKNPNPGKKIVEGVKVEEPKSAGH